jgi:SAM-dependent methyltransferase
MPSERHGAGTDDRARWNARYAAGDSHARAAAPLPFLERHLDLLPKGTALDLAMGAGRNAVYLAASGFRVIGVDISEEALKKSQALAAERGVEIEGVAADLETYILAPESYAVIVCTYYLQRSLFPRIEQALLPGGVAVLETYTIDHLRHHPDFSRRYLLEPGELFHALAPLRILRYQDVDDGRAAYASVLVRKDRHHEGALASESRNSRTASK